MKKALNLTNKDFESDSQRTPQYLAWHRTFKREFTKFLTERGATNIAIGKPNHFDMSGFFTIGTQAWYFSVGDLRNFRESLLLRTAKSYSDYTGGRNEYVSLKSGEIAFTEGFERLMAAYKAIEAIKKDIQPLDNNDQLARLGIPLDAVALPKAVTVDDLRAEWLRDVAQAAHS